MIKEAVPVGVLLTATMLVQSCLYDGIRDCSGYYNSLHIDDHWNLAPDADPQGMAAFFFGKDGNAVWRFDLVGKDGGEVRLPMGDYAFVTLNDDTAVLFEDTGSYESMFLSTASCGLLPGATDRSGEDVPVRIISPAEETVMCPEMLWYDSSPCVSLGIDRLSYVDLSGGDSIRVSPFLILPAHPRSIVCKYHLVVTGVSNLEGVSRISAAISGMTGQIKIADLSHSRQGVTLPFQAARSGESGIYGEFLTFGLTSDPSVRNILSLFVWLVDGTRHCYEFDVTSQTTGADDPMDVWIRLQGLELPVADDNHGSFDVTVDRWNTIVINIGGS